MSIRKLRKAQESVAMFGCRNGEADHNARNAHGIQIHRRIMKIKIQQLRSVLVMW